MLSACAGRGRIPPPEAPPPAFREPSDAIPAELDFALRIDLAKIRGALGETAFDLLRDKSAARDPVTTDALARADTVWVALRPSDRGAIDDSVTIVRGRFGAIDPHRRPEWGPATDLGAGWRRFDRKGKAPRSEPARIYARGDDVLVFVTVAALDSVERRLEQGVLDDHLDPAEKGVLSVDARPRTLGRLATHHFPTVGRLLERSERLRVTADLDGQGLRAELELELGGESEARAVAESLGSVARALGQTRGLGAQIAEGLVIEAVGARAVVRLKLPSEALARVVRCAGGGGCE
ncbi:MAG: hypothetical protein IT377_11350 [Polyangiaceae bacterium]|nr:hypothetical protein [Myxococcales bacterium]MCC6899564.1 hypothetical protein [Polyangiaceae bacterium]